MANLAYTPLARLSTPDTYVTYADSTMGDVSGSSAAATMNAVFDVEAGPAASPRPSSETDQLCKFDKTGDQQGIEGKRRLVVAVILCSIFMVGEVNTGLPVHEST